MDDTINPELDGVPDGLLKNNIGSLFGSYWKLVQRSFSSVKLPDVLQSIFIFPICKGRPKNYR